MVLVLKFLKVTDIEGKKGAKKQEKKWKWRNDKMEEKLLGEWIKVNKKTELKGKKSQMLDLKHGKTVQKKITKRCYLG